MIELVIATCIFGASVGFGMAIATHYIRSMIDDILGEDEDE